jgi:hypothetical protein
MNFNKYIVISVALTLFSHLSASAQSMDTMGLKTIISKTNNYTQTHPFEKIYMHMDKPYYSVGDTVRFKAYVTIGLHQPSDLSRIMYIDIVSSRDSLVKYLKFQVFNGAATGSFVLSQANFKQGNYHLSAYTNWMRNFDPAYFFNKTIPIGNPVDNQVLTTASFTGSIKNKQQKIDAHIQFKDPVGNPYDGKKISWIIDNDDDKPLKGKAVTDDKGYLNIPITATKAPILSTNYLVTTMDLGNRKIVTNSFPLRSAVGTPDMQFFPEGGDLITGVRTKVAFKAIKPDGLGTAVKGTVTDNSGTEVAQIQSQNMGMGYFVLTPQDGKTYKANVTFADGTQNTIDLPAVKPSGIALAVYNTNPDTLNLKITASDAYFLQNKDKLIYIVGQSGGFVCYAAQTLLRNNILSAAVLKSKFPTGIAQITLFSGGTPLSERIVFIQHNDGLKLNLSAGGTKFSPRQQVKMQVSAKANNAPVAASLSVSVVDETKVPFNDDAEPSILTSLLLSSDIKGYIEKPGYYFNHPGEKTAADLDVLMLTQGYRRFSYKDILLNKPAGVRFLPELGMEITGTLRTSNGMPVAKGNVRLMIPDKNYSIQTTTNMVGEFKFSKLVIPDSSKVIITGRNNPNNNNLMVMLDGNSLQGIASNINYPDEILNIDTALSQYMVNTKREYNNLHTLKEVQITEKPIANKTTHQDFPSLTGLSFADHDISGDRLKDCPNFADCLKTMLMGMTYYENNFYITRDYNQGKKSTPVAIFYNGLNVDYNYLLGVNSAEVESVEVFLTDGLSGINRQYQTNGVIEINTKKTPKGTKITADQLHELFPPKYQATITPKGFDMGREFYSPKYTGPVSITQHADLRSTIYWNPHLTTDKVTGATTFDFYNSDSPGTYKAIIEGIDADGNIGRSVIRYTVH